MTRTECVERIVKGWAPTQGVCVACGEGRRPVAVKEYTNRRPNWTPKASNPQARNNDNHWDDIQKHAGMGATEVTITGYACACPDASAPTREAVVIDPFCTTRTR